jgi:uncharacterized OB-fold protein
MSERRIPAPIVNPENKPFWDAAAQGRLLIKRCRDCSQPHYYPRALCPFCFSDATEWIDAKGTGEIYSYSVLRRGAPVPYALAYVTLDEGVSMLTNLVDCDFDALSIGQRVKVVFKPSEDGAPVPVFTPA